MEITAMLVLLLLLRPGNDPYRAVGAYAADDTTRRLSATPFATRADSLQQVEEFRKEVLRNSGTGWQLLAINFVELDTVFLPGSRQGTILDKGGRFLKVSDMRICDGCRFTLDSGRYFLQYPATLATGNQPVKAFLQKEISVRFTLADNVRQRGHLLVPVQEAGTLLEFFGVVLSIAAAGFFLYVLFTRPIRMLHQIARGNFFDRSHGRTLLLLSIGLMAIAVLPVLFTVLMTQMYSDTITDAFRYHAWDALWNRRPLLGAGLAVGFLAAAFQRGYKLQQLNDSIV